MVQAGAPTDAVIDELVPLLEPGDIVVDGGNAHFLDTRRREAALRERVAFYGQLEHARLLQLDRQLDLLDAWAGGAVAALLDDYTAAWSAAFSSPRPRSRAAEMAAGSAASVNGAISMPS